MKTKASRSVLVIDDEPEYLEWVFEYLEYKGHQVDSSLNLADALKATHLKKYDLILLDMNIPAGGAVSSLLTEPILEKYPGLAVAIRLRNQGYWPYQIVAYTVHDDDAISAELDKLNCRYVLKGRPNILKSVIQSSFEILDKKS